jgi:4-hydroxy 2-oxovalerate aldolase
MKNIDNLKLIDVSLRDGGYRNNFCFGIEYVLEHAKYMQAAGIDYIEIGYRNGSVVQYESMGVTGYSKNEYIRTLKNELSDIKLVVIVHAANIKNADIYEMAENGVSLLRFCMNAKNVDETLRLARLAKQAGMTTSINVVRVSSIELPTLRSMVGLVERNRDVIDLVYFADSNGHLTPESVCEISNEIRACAPTMELGFHAHDNIGLAMSNSIAAAKSGVSHIDASLLGMGKGIGNLKLEKWIASLIKNGSRRYSLIPILRAAAILRNSPDYVEDQDEYSVDILCGLYNYPFTDRNKANAILAGEAGLMGAGPGLLVCQGCKRKQVNRQSCCSIGDDFRCYTDDRTCL